MSKAIFRYLIVFLTAVFISFSCARTTKVVKDEVSETYVSDNYTKQEVKIKMRDGVSLHTTIYSPKDSSKEYPIIMQRTPYSSSPYGEGEVKKQIGPNIHLMQEGNIIVYQDVRGRWLSEGTYENMRAYIPNKTSDKDVDESTDTCNTEIRWQKKRFHKISRLRGAWSDDLRHMALHKHTKTIGQCIMHCTFTETLKSIKLCGMFHDQMN